MRLHIRKQITGFFNQENEVNKIMVEKKTVGHIAVQAIFFFFFVLLALSRLLPFLYNLAVSFSSKEEAGLVSFWPIGFTRDTCYPASKVNYEQSIVAPAADILLSVYALTKEERYLTAAERQIQILELFNGMQPDYHLYEVAIRHWDGYWFGKRRYLGDTFPHYWSALTGNVFELYGRPS